MGGGGGSKGLQKFLVYQDRDTLIEHLDSIHHIQSARSRKQNKTDYLQLLAEFDRLNIANYYETIEITVLGHYQVSSIQNLVNLFRFIFPELNTSKSGIRS